MALRQVNHLSAHKLSKKRAFVESSETRLGFPPGAETRARGADGDAWRARREAWISELASRIRHGELSEGLKIAAATASLSGLEIRITVCR